MPYTPLSVALVQVAANELAAMKVMNTNTAIIKST